MTTERRKVQLRNRELGATMTVIGLILFICNWFKIVPGIGNPFTAMITTFIAYGFIIGLLMMFLGVVTYLEIFEY